MAEAKSSDALARLEHDVAKLKTILVEGNGHSLVTQVALIVHDISDIRKEMDEREAAMRREVRVGLAVATGVISLVISGWKVFG